MAENEKINLSFDHTLAPALLEIVREKLGEQHPFLAKMIGAIDQHNLRGVKLVTVVFAKREELNDFRNISAELNSRAVRLNEAICVAFSS